MRVLLLHEARGEVAPMAGLTVPLCTPADFVAHAGVSPALVAPALVAPVGQPPLVAPVTGATQPQLAREACDALVTTGVMQDGGWL